MKHTTPSLDIVIVTSTHVKRFHIGRQYQACLDHPGVMVHVASCGIVQVLQCMLIRNVHADDVRYAGCRYFLMHSDTKHVIIIV